MGSIVGGTRYFKKCIMCITEKRSVLIRVLRHAYCKDMLVCSATLIIIGIYRGFVIGMGSWDL